MLPASLLTPPVLLPAVPVPVVLPVADPLVDEPVALPLAEAPPAAELPPAPPPPPLCANANGPPTASAAAKTIIAGFMVSFRGCFESVDKPPIWATFLFCDLKSRGRCD